jgi:diguanylate cyclase (GGDEF)-like protein
MTFKKILPAIIILLLVITVTQSLAAEPLVLSEPGQYEIGPHLEFLKDPGHALTIEQVTSPEIAAGFRPNRNQKIDVGHSKAVWWFRFKLIREKDTTDTGESERYPQKWFIHFDKPCINQIDLYIPMKHPGPGTDHGFLVKRTGAEFPLSSRDIRFRSYILELPTDFRDGDWFYVRIRSVVSINMSVAAWTHEALTQHTWMDFLGFGVVYGILLGMTLYNFIIFIFLRDRVYLHYVLYMVSIFIYHLFNYGHLDTLMDLPPAWVLQWHWMALGNIWLWGAVFVRSFLNLKENSPFLNKVAWAIIIVSAILIVFGLFGLSRLTNIVSNILTPVISGLGLTAGIVCLRRGFKPARYFLIAWTFLLVGATLYAMGGIVIEQSFITVYMLVIGSSMEALLLSLALADRIRVLQSEKEALEQEERRLRELTVRDGLTALYNKRFLMGRLAGEIETAQKLNQSLSLLMMDVDDFKKFNDEYGHVEGDQVLIRLARIIRKSARDTDTACRYGGEEFTVILPGAPAGLAGAVAERIRESFAQQAFTPRSGEVVTSSVSIGLAEFRGGETVEDLISRADEALYRAKRAGKNRVVAT